MHYYSPLDWLTDVDHVSLCFFVPTQRTTFLNPFGNFLGLTVVKKVRHSTWSTCKACCLGLWSPYKVAGPWVEWSLLS